VVSISHCSGELFGVSMNFMETAPGDKLPDSVIFGCL